MSNLDSWAVLRIQAILPLDTESLQQVVAYANSLDSPEDVANHFKGMLGDDSDSLDFISQYNARRWPPADPARVPKREATKGSTTPSRAQTPVIREPSKPKALTKEDLAKAFGGGGSVYMKGQEDEDYFGGRGKAKAKQQSIAPGRPLDPAPEQVSKPAVKTNQGGLMTSDLLAPKKKKTPATSTSTSAGFSPNASSAHLSSLAEIDSALRLLDLADDRKKRKRRPCNCQAILHPLFMAAPNCLNCGKIICAAEGIGPCTFCGVDVLSKEQQLELVNELRKEKGQLKMQADQKKKVRTGQVQRGYASHAGGSVHVPDEAEAEMEAKRLAAEERKETLLGYDRNSVRRTHIIDEASDFDMPQIDKWASPAERALALRKQQKALEAMSKQKRKVMAIDLSGRRAHVTYDEESEPEAENQFAEEEAAIAQDKAEMERAKEERLGGGAFAQNPLLKKYARPKYIPPKGKGKAGETDHSATWSKLGKKLGTGGWKRVQDDDADREAMQEQLILGAGAIDGEPGREEPSSSRKA
ncbi:zf-C2HC5-domain-containing protein [Saitoella complicata NRRL Y-17804]|nr:zf-C2HC5-domain-containing protein [Saitoella complicata NRRL Y-17804]ODQ56209.1 zf-C2HC5-domain-containing protein [Saitoella complicata NRRL Y-17804]